MSLFRLQSEPVNGTGACRGPGRRHYGRGTPCLVLAHAIGRLRPNTDTHFTSNGAWSLHDVIRYTLDQTGPGDVAAFTWSMMPSAADALLDMLASGLIRSLSIVMDAAQKKLSRGAFETIAPRCRQTRLCQIHAKGALIHAGAWRVSIITSQNLSRNPRYEVGVLSTAPDVYAFHAAWLMPLLAGGDPLNVGANHERGAE